MTLLSPCDGGVARTVIDFHQYILYATANDLIDIYIFIYMFTDNKLTDKIPAILTKHEIILIICILILYHSHISHHFHFIGTSFTPLLNKHTAH